jgi:hypothetical protein
MLFFYLDSSVTSSFSFLEWLYVLYFNLVRSKLVYTSVVWHSIGFTDANKLEQIQHKSAVLCFNRVFPLVHYVRFTGDKTAQLTHKEV